MPRLLQKSIKILMPYVYSRPNVYPFGQIFHALRLFPALRRFRTLEYIQPKAPSQSLVSLEGPDFFLKKTHLNSKFQNILQQAPIV